ncbi:transglutaminase-like domain-containing protein [Thermococcus sp.]|uniref:transglutaminase-like domain-containing protein n=1 Tax=Thermococcus sp. TaxID=35749 RepID=UPI0026395990|nr:transglutaminase-like domain-containing protein [Thermococcus sp.]
MRREGFALVIALMVLAAGCLVGVPNTGTGGLQSSPTSETSTPATWMNPFVHVDNLTVRLPSEDARLNCTTPLWRYILKDAASCMLSERELNVIKPLGTALKGRNIEESVWNVLEWEGKNLHYNWTKANETPSYIEVRSNGRNEVVSGGGSELQTPYETIKRGAGICTDYTLLTDALLLSMGYSPVYMMEPNLSKSAHSTAVIRVEGWYFVLDQHLPPMDLDAYYGHWRKIGDRIVNATLYEISTGENRASVKRIGFLNDTDFLKQAYVMDEHDALGLATGMEEVLSKEFNITVDRRLSTGQNGVIPQGYNSLSAWSITFEEIAALYNPAFYSEYVNWLLRRVLAHQGIAEGIRRAKAIWIDVKNEGGNLKVIIYVGEGQ